MPHSFGGISAYDGHRSGVGRVVTDATWHHFVNINLVGDIGEPEGTVKSLGFLASASGQAHFEEIKTYYRNIATWLARPENISCMNSRLVIKLVKAGEAPLGANEGLKKAASLLPASRILEGYVAVDQLMNTIGEISKVVDNPDPPPAFPKIDAPVAVVAGPVGSDTFQMDIAAPMPFVVAVKDVIMAAQAGPPPAGPPEETGEAPAGTAPADG